MRQLREAGIHVPILSGDGFDSDLVKRLGKKSLANKVYFSTHAYRFSDTPEVREFKDVL